MKPADFLKASEKYLDELKAAKALIVKVGIPGGGQQYPDGTPIVKVGAQHEYGTREIPMRSFLRVPFRVKDAEIKASIAKEMKALLTGQSAKDGLAHIGITALNISRGAFTTKGYGEWQDIKPATKKAKGSSQPLIDTGILRGALTWEVTNATS